MAEVVRIPVHRGRVLWIGAKMALLVLFLVIFALLMISLNGFGWAYGMILAGGSTASFATAILFGIALRRPTAPRMDAKGISGFFTSPASWIEISDIGVVTVERRKRLLGFALHDPVAFRDRRSA